MMRSSIIVIVYAGGLADLPTDSKSCSNHNVHEDSQIRFVGRQDLIPRVMCRGFIKVPCQILSGYPGSSNSLF